MSLQMLRRHELKPRLRSVRPKPDTHSQSFPKVGAQAHKQAALRFPVGPETKAFYRRFYGPNGAVVVIAGDVEPEQARKFAEETYGKVKRNDMIVAPRVAGTRLS